MCVRLETPGNLGRSCRHKNGTFDYPHLIAETSATCTSNKSKIVYQLSYCPALCKRTIVACVLKFLFKFKLKLKNDHVCVLPTYASIPCPCFLGNTQSSMLTQNLQNNTWDAVLRWEVYAWTSILLRVVACIERGSFCHRSHSMLLQTTKSLGKMMRIMHRHPRRRKRCKAWPNSTSAQRGTAWSLPSAWVQESPIAHQR